MSAHQEQQHRLRDPLVGDSDETETNASSDDRASRDGGTSTSTIQLLEDISHDQAMQNLLTNERYADIQLQSSDGAIIHANRAMLAARSPMFDRMLYGNFAERTSTTVVVSYTNGDILKAIVQYIYRDDCDVFHYQQRQAQLQSDAGEVAVIPVQQSEIAGSSGSSVNTGNLDWINTIVAIFDAAHYFSLPSLCRKTKELARSIMEDDPSSAGLFLAACETAEREAGAATTDLEQLSLELIGRNPKGCLLRENNPNILQAFRQMTSNQLQKVLTYPHLDADEHTRFLLLHAWANAFDGDCESERGDNAHSRARSNGTSNRNMHTSIGAPLREEGTSASTVRSTDASVASVAAGGSTSSATDNQDTQRMQRKRCAAEMTEHLHLEQIDASQLSSIVKSSGLVSTEQFCQAYKQQAMLAGYLKVRTISWKSNNGANGVVFDCTSEFNHSVELLNCRALRDGIHKWSIKLECSGGNDQYLGVAACCTPPSSSDDDDDNATSDNSGLPEVDMNQWLGCQTVGWVYGSNGSACHAMGHNTSYYGDRRPVFDQGSVINFLLDLTTGGGTLSASVDGLATCQLFTNMLSELPADQPHAGFVPAVSLRTPGRVRFLGFDVSS